jgi:hypothetical protein
MIQPKQPAPQNTQLTETSELQITEVSQNVQQVPTIQLMINASDGRKLDINVNNYCIAPQPVPSQPISSNLNLQHKRAPAMTEPNQANQKQPITIPNQTLAPT